jgi:hypothetical protein
MILVDGVQEHVAPGLRYKRWSHLVSTIGESELHAFAARLGLRREWGQLRPRASAAHYDVVPTKRALALQLGAREVTSRNLARLNYDGLTRRGLRGAELQSAADEEAARLTNTCSRPALGHPQ